MGASRNAVELARKFDRYSKEVELANRRGVEAAAQVVKSTTIPLVRAATGGDLRLSGVGKKGAKVGLRYDVKGTVNATAIVYATGPAHFVESDVKQHPVTSRYAPRGFADKAISGPGVDNSARARRGRGALVAAGLRTAAERRKVSGWGPRAVIKYGNVVARYAVKSGGSRGRHPYRTGFDRAAKVAPEQFAKAHRRALASVFR